MIRRPPRSTLFPTRRSSDLVHEGRRLPEDAAAAQLFDDQRVGILHELSADDGHLLGELAAGVDRLHERERDRKSTRLNSSHANISYAVFCLKKTTTLLALFR